VASLRGALLAQLSQNHGISTDPTVDQWAKALDNVAAWDNRQLEEFVRFLRKAEDGGEPIWNVFSELNEDVLRLFQDKDAELWPAIAHAYTQYARRPFDFAYCDVIVRRLEAIFELGDLSLKAAAAIAAADLGRAHNRWFVMGRVLSLCGPTLAADVAERVGIEIEVEEARDDFIICAESIGRSPLDYHHRIAARLIDA
jgi:hypothetical protein